MELSIQERLKDLRVERGLTLEQLAEKTHLSKSALGSYEGDNFKDISHYALIELAKFYEVTVDYLLGRSQTRNHPNADLADLHLSDDMIELLKSGLVDNSLLCELATHPDFPRLMADLEIYVNGVAGKQVQSANAIVDAVSATIMKQHNPGLTDPQLRQLIAAHIDDDSFCRYVIQQDINKIALDLREAHKDDFFSVPEDNPLEDFLQTAEETTREDSDPEDNSEFEKMIDAQEQEQGMEYAALQRKAIVTALSRGIMILTGGPGTGKTTTLNGIISLYEKQGYRVMIAAPTGRAASRISDLTGYEASTIHRMLEVEYDASGGMGFQHDERNPLECDVMVVDEMSMVDVLLFEHLLRALRLSCKVVLVGDCDQLPSVGAGNLLRDLIDSGRVPVVALKEIFRQAQKSSIITNAHKIIGGEYPDLTQKKSDCFFFQRLKPDAATELMLELVKTRLPKAYGYSPMEDIQVITPSRKGVMGVIELNQRLQAVLNPPSPSLPEVKSMLYTFREGDKVMQIKNNYKLEWKIMDAKGRFVKEEGVGVFNGDVGFVKEIDEFDQKIVVEYDDGRLVDYLYSQLDELEHAYAITIHKSQGSEYPVVVIPLLTGPAKLLNRNLLYTAVTRARKGVVIVGNIGLVKTMIDNIDEQKRYTTFAERLVELA